MIMGHYDANTGRKQPLEEHLFNVAVDASRRSSAIKQNDVLFLLGLFHDLGKAHPDFQDKLLNHPNHHVDHSSAGAYYLLLKIQQYLIPKGIPKKSCQLFSEVVGYVISSHHGMYDLYDKEANRSQFNRLMERLTKFLEKVEFDKTIQPFAANLELKLSVYGYEHLEDLIVKSYANFKNALDKLPCKDDTERDFYIGAFVRLYLSFLKNADILDTVNAYEEVIIPSNEEKNQERRDNYLQSVEDLYRKFEKANNDLNQVRTMIAERVKERGQKDTAGIYRLNLPTGAGKTKASLRYAVQQMACQDRKRFYYVTAFLSVLEQNAKDIKAIIGEDGVLEHHSNVVREKEFQDFNEETYDEVMQEYLLDSWDSPVVLTTMVQFFQTLFKIKSANIRRFSNLANSVMVLDEVQSLPIEVTSLFNLTMNFMSRVMNTTIILCTATQPAYDYDSLVHQLVYGGEVTEQADIVSLMEEERVIFERTELKKLKEDNSKVTLSEVAEFVLEQEESVLVILNTKPSVYQLHQLLSEQTNRPLYQLSTNMCPQHRLDTISEIKKLLKEDIPLICVSTQLIEAGVDVDFARVIRSYAGLDSIVQASGRCNREGKRDLGQVILVNISNEDENISRLTEIKKKKSVTEDILCRQSSPIDVSVLNDEFFKRYYENNTKDMDYPLGDNQTAYDFLSYNHYAGFQLKGMLRQAFKTAGQKIDLIKDESIGVFVPYGNSIAMLEDFETFLTDHPYPNFEDYTYIKERMKNLQLYTVNAREDSSFLKQAKSYLGGQIWILPQKFYDDKMGIKKEADALLIF
ncbi:CRISPR-associated helicase/endonuclease Cas3 [Streptococcus pseudoporcinus]|uniref:CRISPR-associated helicase Cas3 n=1 Tax=Streptococcus pseudoporcinus LQ 940-04 TaxID=875093 RepID=G5K9U5_9STRE|nr:CRISPR-associated helicase/endonuclease Cas3 [Streptococcus pseudoporcinus]EFR44826.1 CRISPR-associated endonuclease Cas3-HD [Streptococcus pseudoporcinus SPIN 20026]EHI64318.1 CRISPR-associated helicase Cas3 [Streptococcus pseudoporcinus LQ 940-04]VEF93469.1 CRISPR-associated helicase [Streptococcus pseudoporcinus]